MKNEIIIELVEKAKKGDEAATEELYRLHSRRVYGLCVRMVANQAEAEDLTQDIFLQAFRKIHTFRGESTFSTWLYRLGVNTVLMHLRKKPHAEVPLDEISQPNGDVIRRIEPADKTDHGQIMVSRLVLQRALEQLPPGFKRAVVMHDLEGYAHHEIARLTGRSIGSSKSQLHKARHRLRELLVESPHLLVPQKLSGAKVE